MCFFCNDTATTEIYTYGHTLSLHDAVPIAEPLRAQHAVVHPIRPRHDRQPDVGRLGRRDPRARIGRPRGGAEDGFVLRAEIVRSEAHTSELQSLMRTSYAVLCLKHKKQQHTAPR